MTSSAEVRDRLVRELRLDLVGPRNDHPEFASEVLPEPPSRWYLTGFLVPLGASPRQKEVDPQEEMDEAEGAGGGDDDQTPERTAARKSRLPSSIGISVLVEAGTPSPRATVRWGDYRRDAVQDGDEPADETSGGRRWRREPREAIVEVPLRPGRPLPLDGSGGLELVRHVRPTRIHTDQGERKVAAASLFVVNRRMPIEQPGREDEASAFQVEIELEGNCPSVARGDVKGRDASDPDARIGDLHYRDVVEWAVGHNTSVAATLEDGVCRRVRTAWMPETPVPRMVPGQVEGVVLDMERLAAVEDGPAAHTALDRPIDVALATNMISVGLDVLRLGLMVVSGQPKTASEYIQATSRVGRDPMRPGLVVTLLNLNKPRDRSHYERFAHWHGSFYRAVEAVSVTPFAPRALDCGLAASMVALVRLGWPELSPLLAAGDLERLRPEMGVLVDRFGERVDGHRADVPPSLVLEVRSKVTSLLDDWAALAHDYRTGGTAFGYTLQAGVTKPLLREMLDP